MKFGIRLPQIGASYGQVRETALACEDLGFDSIWLMDHLFGPDPNVSFLECWVTLSALAAETRKIRLGSLVTCNSYRYPFLLAKMAATLDNISQGRVELGIGAGWHESEYKAFGIPFYTPRIRIEALEEAVQIIKRLWTDARYTFTGRHYSIEDAVCNPKPVQKPHPRIWIGGEGKRLLLRVVAELADGCNFRPCTPEEYARKLEILNEHCKVVGRELETVEKSLAVPVICGYDEDEAKKKILLGRNRHPRQEVRDMSYEEYVAPRVVGTPEQCINKIQRYLDAGVTHFVFSIADSLNVEAYRFFKKEIIDRLNQPGTR